MSPASQGPMSPGILWAAALGGFLALAVSGSAQAQTYESLGEGVTVGHFVLHPSMSYEYTYDSNILFMSTDLPGSDPIASGVNVVRARILADLPIGGSRIRFVYAPFYRGYTNDRYQPEDRLNQDVSVEALFHTDRAMTIAFRDRYVNGTLSLQEQVERNGLPVGLGHYAAHTPQLEFGVSLGVRHGFSILPGYSRTDYTGVVLADQIVDYGFTSRTVEGRYNYKLSEPTTLYGYTAFDDTIQAQTDIPDITIRSRSIGFGLARTLSEGRVTRMSAGYQTLDFEGGHGQNFSGPVAEANVVWKVAEWTRIDFGFLRKPFATISAPAPDTAVFDAGSNYYIATEGWARWTRQFGRSSYMDAGAKVQQNRYVVGQGVDRMELLIRLEVGAGHLFQKNVRGYIGLNFDQRESNVLQLGGGVGADPFHYQLYRILFRFDVGWL